MSELTELSKEVAILKTDMAQVSGLIDRLDLTIAKLTEVSTTVSQLLAVQGNRLEQQEKSAYQFSALLEKRRDEAAESNEIMHKRISSAEKEFQTEIAKLNDKILDEMKSMRDAGFSTKAIIGKNVYQAGAYAGEKFKEFAGWLYEILFAIAISIAICMVVLPSVSFFILGLICFILLKKKVSQVKGL
jgi:hypothetical protein